MKRTFLAFIGLFALLTAAQAQQAIGRVTFGPLLAVQNPFGYGGQADYRFAEHYSVGVIGRYWTRTTSLQAGSIHWNGYAAQATLGAHACRSYQADPYVKASIGWSESTESFDETVPVADRVSSICKGVAVSASMGLRYFITPWLAVNCACEMFLTDKTNLAGKLGLNLGIDLAF